VKLKWAAPESAATSQHPDVGNLSRVGQKCGDLADAPGPTVRRNWAVRPSSRLPRMVNLTEADLDPHQGNFVLNEPSAPTVPTVSPGGTGAIIVIRRTPSSGSSVHSPDLP
jgi:hypothetical protein